MEKEIEFFKDNLSNQNRYHIIRCVFKCPEQFTPLEIKVSISGYLKNKFQILNFQCWILFPFFFSGRFFRDGRTGFLEIFRKDALPQYLGKFFRFLNNSLPVGKYGRFLFLKKSFCPTVFSDTVKDRVTNFPGMVDLLIGVCLWVCGCHPSLLVQTESDKKIENFKFNPIPHYYVPFQMSKTVDPTRSWSVNFQLLQKEVSKFLFYY
jgi:hypothetical protein